MKRGKLQSCYRSWPLLNGGRSSEVQTMALADEVAADIPAMDTAELTRGTQVSACFMS